MYDKGVSSIQQKCLRLLLALNNVFLNTWVITFSGTHLFFSSLKMYQSVFGFGTVNEVTMSGDHDDNDIFEYIYLCVSQLFCSLCGTEVNRRVFHRLHFVLWYFLKYFLKHLVSCVLWLDKHGHLIACLMLHYLERQNVSISVFFTQYCLYKCYISSHNLAYRGKTFFLCYFDFHL